MTGTQETLGAVQQRLAQLAGTRSLLGTQGVAYLLVALSVAAYVVDLLVGGDRNREGRDTSRQTGVSARLILLVLAGAVVLSATAAMVGPAGPQEFGVISSESDSPGLRVIEQGTTESTRYVLGNGGFVPMVTYVEPVTEGVTFEPRETVVPARSTVNATLSITAPEDTGYYRYFVVEHRYLHLLPQSTIRSLYRIHPWAPIVTIDALLAGSFYVLGAALVDTGRVRSRSRDAPSSLDRLRSRFR
ncbi:hypothetical protein ACFQL1_13085 [Halomicroarcula sp. GCM10025709]|uniref:hypothetical protein n=1 Tax=Halomicroarcula sp. GCM10025709 TaxID=3252669 RepID=UPI00361898F4